LRAIYTEPMTAPSANAAHRYRTSGARPLCD
jgi:hypothetical protein